MIDSHGVIRVERPLPAGPDQAFDGWVVPAVTSRWLFATPGGQIVRCDIDARPGGAFVVTDRRDGEDVEHVGTYLEVDRPRTLAFTFGVPKYSSELSRVVVTILPSGSGSVMTLENHDVPPEWRSQTEQGWTDLLGRLEEALRG